MQFTKVIQCMTGSRGSARNLAPIHLPQWFVQLAYSIYVIHSTVQCFAVRDPRWCWRWRRSYRRFCECSYSGPFPQFVVLQHDFGKWNYCCRPFEWLSGSIHFFFPCQVNLMWSINSTCPVSDQVALNFITHVYWGGPYYFDVDSWYSRFEHQYRVPRLHILLCASVSFILLQVDNQLSPHRLLPHTWMTSITRPSSKRKPTKVQHSCLI